LLKLTLCKQATKFSQGSVVVIDAQIHDDSLPIDNYKTGRPRASRIAPSVIPSR
jgi:hypothetical protein